MIKLIAAVSKNRAIGINGGLIFNDKDDLANFKKETINQVVIMGRKTWESLSKKPLSDRINIVLTSSPETLPEGIRTISSVDEIPALEKEFLLEGKDIYIIGGGHLYKETIGMADCLVISHFDTIAEGDTYFPKIDEDVFRCKYIKPTKNFTLKIYYKKHG